MGKVTKVGGNILKNMKLDTKDPSMWLNGVIILLILVVFILLAVQVFTPRKDVVDGFHSIPITNRNLPWPFNDVKFDPIYYNLVYAGRTKNGSADGEAKIYYSKSFLPHNKDRLPLAVQNSVYASQAGRTDVPALGIAGEFEYNYGLSPKSGDANRNKKVNVKRWMDDDADFNVNPYTKDSPKEHVFPLNQNLGMFRDVLSVLQKQDLAGAGGGGANTPLTFWRKDGGYPADNDVTRTDSEIKAGETIFLPISLLKKYLEVLNKKGDLVKFYDGRAGAASNNKEKAELKKLQDMIKSDEYNYQNFIMSIEADDHNLVLFEGVWKEGRLTKAIIADCKGVPATGGGATTPPISFVIYYNDKEQVEDDKSVKNAIQFLRTPLYASCMGS